MTLISMCAVTKEQLRLLCGHLAGKTLKINMMNGDLIVLFMGVFT